MRNLSMLLVVSWLLAGCALAPSGPLFSPAPNPPDGHALLYLYRPYSQAFVGVPVFLNGIRVATLPDEGYTWIFVEPGRYIVTTTPPGKTEPPLQDPLEFTVSADHRYYLRHYTTRAKLHKTDFSIVPVPGLAVLVPHEQKFISSTWYVRSESLSEKPDTFELETLYQFDPDIRNVKAAQP